MYYLQAIPFHFHETKGEIDDIIPFSGNLGVASFFAELFQMQYCNGIEVGWGISQSDLLDILKVREMDNFLGINYWTAMNLGSDLMLHLYKELETTAEMYFLGKDYKKIHLFLLFLFSNFYILHQILF